MRAFFIIFIVLLSTDAFAKSVVVKDLNVFHALEAIEADGWDRERVRRVTSALLQRGRSEEALQVMSALQSAASGETVSFNRYSVGYAPMMALPEDRRPAPGPGDITTVRLGPATPTSAEFLNVVVPHTVEGGASFDEMWLVEDKTKLIYFVAMLAPPAKNQITGLIARKLNAQWEESSISNGYAPFRDDLRAAAEQLEEAAGDDQELEDFGKEVLCEAAKLVHRNSKKEMPDFLYNWVVLSPDGQPGCTFQG